MSFKLMAQAINLQVGNPTRKLVLLKLADQANDDGLCYPSIASIQKSCEIKSPNTVRAHINALERMGLLRIERRWNDEKQCSYSNVYHLTLDNTSKNNNSDNNPAQSSAGSQTEQKNLPTAKIEVPPAKIEGGTAKIEGGTAKIEPEPITKPITEPITESKARAIARTPAATKTEKSPIPEPAKTSHSMQKPTLEQVTKYFAQRNHPTPVTEAEHWIDYYSANGWKIGKNPMKDWKAAVRNWIRRDNQLASSKQSNHQRHKEQEKNHAAHQQNINQNHPKQSQADRYADNLARQLAERRKRGNHF